MSRRMVAAVALIGTLAGCAATTTPVPVQGRVDQLVGRWTGDYGSPQTGRMGSIVFTLAAGSDTASGDVLMIPPNYDNRPMPTTADDPARRSPRVLRISFVRCEGNAVTGWLDPYQDPDTGELISTSFEGTLKGDKLEGRYLSSAEGSGRRTSGTWAVTRKPLP